MWLTLVAALAAAPFQVPDSARGAAVDTPRVGVEARQEEQRRRRQREPWPVPDSATVASAYVDAGARELVRLARERRAVIDRSIRSYQALGRERISMGLRALRRERLLYRREAATRIDWSRDTVRIEVLGAREVVPIALPGARVPSNLNRFARHLAFDPSDPRLLIEPRNCSDCNDDLRHPLAEGSEADYRFATGDTTEIRLQDGRRIRLIEVRVLPRRRDFRLVGGSLWLEADGHSVVQAVFRLARPFDLERDGDAEDVDDIPGLVKPIIMPVRVDIRYITIEYGLWEMRWWLPRLVALEGVAQAGSFLSTPLRYELAYTDYRVTGDDAGAGPLAATDSLAVSADSADLAAAAPPADGRAGDAPPESAAAPEDAGRRRCSNCVCHRGIDGRRRCQVFEVSVPADSAALLESEHLPPSIYEPGQALLSEAELAELRARLERLAPPEWQLERPRIHWGLGRSGLIRYNRVEGLSVGARAELDLGRLLVDGSARAGTADREPNGELGVTLPTLSARYRLAGYRRLAAMDPASRALGVGNSLTALLFGRDDGDYYRALGVELTGAPAEAAEAWYAWRLYAERHTAAEAESDFSVRRLLNDEHGFRPNLAADSADQVGALVVLRGARGLDPVGFRWGAELSVEAATGDFRFVKPSATLRLAGPLPAIRMIASVEAAAGTSAGDLPVQGLWYLGGPATLRGYAGSAASGAAFWRARAELGTRFPGARLAVFGDGGWAGDRRDVTIHPALLSAGAGASFLDGLIRFDLARALRGEKRWRADLYVDAVL